MNKKILAAGLLLATFVIGGVMLNSTTPPSQEATANTEEPDEEQLAQALAKAQTINNQMTQQVADHLESLRKPLDFKKARIDYQLLENRKDGEYGSWWALAVDLRERVFFSTTDTHEKHHLLNKIDRLISDRTADDLKKQFGNSNEPGKL